jgi:hypothetical protein
MRPRNHRSGREQHGDEEQPTPQEHRREESVLAFADPVPDYTDEPEKGDASEWQQVEC